MLATSENPVACWEFEGDILVLHHPTTISTKYQAMGEQWITLWSCTCTCIYTIMYVQYGNANRRKQKAQRIHVYTCVYHQSEMCRHTYIVHAPGVYTVHMSTRTCTLYMQCIYVHVIQSHCDWMCSGAQFTVAAPSRQPPLCP